MTNKIQRTCQHCGSIFYMYPSRITYGFGLYCSKKCKYEGVSDNFSEKFWSRVDMSDREGCWPYTGFINPSDYGSIGYKGRLYLAPRVAYALYKGFDIVEFPSSIYILHSCDNPPCCKPWHLSLGTAKTNSEDMVRKGRSPIGIRCGTSKLVPSQIIELIKLREIGESYNTISRKLDVNPRYLRSVMKGKYWNHLTGIKSVDNGETHELTYEEAVHPYV